ncbi:hypothetical protein NPIL_605061 [Nephila pilipes]|uniref:Uncharacterized protein n=1 Tax=Nephila pilipes TaxID=299642 RepID=A0A8X6TIM1_NEPPI|nr:hypothetical protein NPIL_605061 [Nephila pilipes]
MVHFRGQRKMLLCQATLLSGKSINRAFIEYFSSMACQSGRRYMTRKKYPKSVPLHIPRQEEEKQLVLTVSAVGKMEMQQKSSRKYSGNGRIAR